MKLVYINKIGQNWKGNYIYEFPFAMWDAVDGIVAMSWENMEGYDEYPEKRLFFSFGEDIESVNDKLYEKDIVLNYNKELINT